MSSLQAGVLHHDALMWCSCWCACVCKTVDSNITDQPAAAAVVSTSREVKLEEHGGLATKLFDEAEYTRLFQFFFSPVATSHAAGMHSRLRSARNQAPRTVPVTTDTTRFDCLDDQSWGVVKKNISVLRGRGEHGDRSRMFTLLRLLEAYLIDPTTPICLPSELLPSQCYSIVACRCLQHASVCARVHVCMSMSTPTPRSRPAKSRACACAR